ncbi:MAG TPA: serine/threonine protein kinase, partial [Myxococcales bacterium]|nr:serine/threonine protein kinase [Myxococcales bacterium]
NLLQREKRLSTSRTVAIVSQVCDALQAAHDAGVIHRDLKPDNVHVISGAGQMGEFIKVLDFGIAKIAAAQHTSQLTQTGSVCGTPAYMSPEQAMGQEIDSRSDVYATGILLYEMLSGQPPFVAETPVALMMAQVRDLPLPLGKAQPGLNISPELDALLLETLSKKPEDRPQSAAILKDRLTRILDGPPTVRKINVDTPPGDLSYIATETHTAIEKTDAPSPDTKPPGTHPAFSASTMDLIEATTKSKRLPWVIAAVLFVAIVAILAYQWGGKDEKKKFKATLDAPATTTQNNAPIKTEELTHTTPKETNSGKTATNTGQTKKVQEKSAENSVKSAKPPETKKAVLSTHIHIDSVPKSSALFDENGVKVALTPYVMARPAAGKEYIYVVKRQGYLPEKIQISATCPETRIATLKKTPAKTKKKTPAKTKKKTPAKTKKMPTFAR